MNHHSVSHDERTTAVENISYRIAYLVLTFGLLTSVAYRGFILHQNSWDLLALVILGGVTATFYQGMKSVISIHWIKVALISFVIAGLLGAVLMLIFRNI